MNIKTKHAGYLEEILNVSSRKKFVAWGKEKLLEIHAKTPIDAIVATGTSGLLLGPILSYLTGIPLLVVRKDTENCHSSNICESNFSIEDRKVVNVVIVDDLISTGTTMFAIHEALCKSFHSYATYPGISLRYAFRGIILYGGFKCGKDCFVFPHNPVDTLPDLCDNHTCDVHVYEE